MELSSHDNFGVILTSLPKHRNSPSCTVNQMPWQCRIEHGVTKCSRHFSELPYVLSSVRHDLHSENTINDKISYKNYCQARFMKVDTIHPPTTLKISEAVLNATKNKAYLDLAGHPLLF